MRMLLEIFGLGLARAVLHQAERADGHDRADDEQKHRALAAVTRVRVAPAGIQPPAGGEGQHRSGELDHARGGHRRKNPQPSASVAAVAMRSSAMTVTTRAPAPLATFLKVRT